MFADRGFRLGALLMLTLATSALSAQATAQSASGAVAPPSLCRVEDGSAASAPAGGAGGLVAICRGAGIALGPADRYSATVSPVLGSVLVVLTRAGRTRVLLASPAAGGTSIRLDDLTRELARRSGRAPDLGLGSLTVDTSRFATDASIGVSGVASRFDLTVYAAAAAAAAAASGVTGQ